MSMTMTNVYTRLWLPTFLCLVIIMFLCDLLRTTYSKENDKIKGFRLGLIHIDSPNSPTYQPELSALERANRLIAISESRLRNLSRKNNTHERMSRYYKPDATISPLSKQGYTYYVEIGIGRFCRRHQRKPSYYHTNYLLFDTGTDFIWTQCDGCRNCFRQRDRPFPKRTSRTYRSAGCKKCPNCQCDEDITMKTIIYGDGEQVKGVVAREAFTFPSGDFNVDFVNEILFICGIDIHNFLPGTDPDNIITGVLGMGYGETSFISQLGNRGIYQFSYCLRDNENLDSPIFLSFGDDIIRPPLMFTTPLYISPHIAGYRLILHDVGVDGRKLNIPSHLFALNSDGSGGTTIDSGTVLSFIVSDAFDIIVNAVTNYISYNNVFLHKYQGQVYHMEACWVPLTDSPTVLLPTLTFYFDNDAELLVQSKVLFWKYPMPGINEPGLYCMPLGRSEPHEGSVIGTSIQTNQRFIYDVANFKLSFAAEDS